MTLFYKWSLYMYMYTANSDHVSEDITLAIIGGIVGVILLLILLISIILIIVYYYHKKKSG